MPIRCFMGFFKSGERAFSLGLSVFLRVAVDRF